jgi:hypothetical protein
MTKRERFEYLQSQARAARADRATFRIDLEVKYGSGNVAYASRGERKRLEQLDAREKRTFDRFFKFLETLSPRAWGIGFPCSWLVYSLTFDDACTRGALSVVPPAAFGYTEHEARQFAGALQTEAR